MPPHQVTPSGIVHPIKIGRFTNGYRSEGARVAKGGLPPFLSLTSSSDEASVSLVEEEVEATS
jgi:hypothetical protein